MWGLVRILLEPFTALADPHTLRSMIPLVSAQLLRSRSPFEFVRFKASVRAAFSRQGLTSFAGLLALATLGLAACEDKGKKSVELAEKHVAALGGVVKSDVAEVRQGLPNGAPHVLDYLLAGKFEDPGESRAALDKARGKVQDLRVAKSTFFALLDPTGRVIRSDQEHDALAGKDFFQAYPALRSALTGSYVETRGELAEASGVRGRKDGQWVAAVGVKQGAETKGVYVTGWSWSAYAYRLENHLRTSVRSALQEREKEPLVYVYVVVDKDVFGAPISPDVNAQVIAAQDFSSKPASANPSSVQVEITGRDFGVAFQRTPELGANVGVVVVRSET